MRYLALNTDGFSDAEYPEDIQFKDPEKIFIDVAEIQNLISDPTNFGHLTDDLLEEAVVAEHTTRGAGRMPSQGELGIRYHLSEFSKRLDLVLQQLFDPQVFPEEGEIDVEGRTGNKGRNEGRTPSPKPPSEKDDPSPKTPSERNSPKPPSEIDVVIITSGCTGTGRGIHLEVAIETKRKLLQSGRRHRIISYILSPEGLSPDDLTEKEKVFYAHLKELNANDLFFVQC